MPTTDTDVPTARARPSKAPVPSAPDHSVEFPVVRRSAITAGTQGLTFGRDGLLADIAPMSLAVGQACPACGRENADGALVCALCGELLRRVQAVQPPIPEPQSAPAQPFAPVEPASDPREPWIYLGIGAITAPAFALTPLLGFMGWFLASLVHEMGHAAVAWILGMPAVPAISLEGHAAAVHSEPSLPLALLVWGGLAAAAWRLIAGRPRWIALAAVVVLYPALAFTRAGECLHLLAGHGGELAFATLALWKALDGGFTESRVERGLYGTVGWHLLGKNVILCGGLLFSSSSREAYAENGSFGLTNDMIRVAEDVLGWRLQSVALLVLVASLGVVPAALALWRVSSRLRAEAQA